MIPVRGPTIFDKQFSEFVNGTNSKSGGKPMRIQMKRDIIAKSKEDAKHLEEQKTKGARINKGSTKAGVPKATSLVSAL